MMGYDKHKFGSKTTVTLAEYWYDSYLSDGTLAQIYDGSTTRLYVGDMVFTRTGTTGTPALESAAWEGGRLINGSGTGNLLYYVTDHLGSVRVVKDGSGTIRQRFDYYPYGSVSRVYTNSSTTDNSIKRYRFGGKEIAGTSLTDLAGTGAAPGAPYLDFGARLYSPGTATWLSVDPMAEKYYGIGPLTYCAGNPVNLVDPEGNIFDLFWDLANVVMDAASLMQDIKEKKLLESLIDGGGLVLDAAAAIVPFIPGGAGTAIKAARLGDKAIDAARAIDSVADVAHVTDNATDALSAMGHGREWEKTMLEVLGEEKNTQKIASRTLSGEAVNVIPDAINETAIIEIKNVRYLSRTKQIQGEFNAAKDTGKSFELYASGSDFSVLNGYHTEYNRRKRFFEISIHRFYFGLYWATSHLLLESKQMNFLSPLAE